MFENKELNIKVHMHLLFFSKPNSIRGTFTIFESRKQLQHNLQN